MADDRLTPFLVRLCRNDCDLLEQFKTEAGRERALLEADPKLKTLTVKAFKGLKVKAMTEFIRNQQGGKPGRPDEANRLAKRAAALAKEADLVAAAANALAGPAATRSRKGGKKKR